MLQKSGLSSCWCHIDPTPRVGHAWRNLLRPSITLDADALQIGEQRRHLSRGSSRPSPPPNTTTTTPHASSRGNRPILSRSIQKPGGCRSREMASPRTITLVALSFALGLFFVFMGTIKLTPRLSKDAYSEMVSLHLLATRCSIVLLDVETGASQA